MTLPEEIASWLAASFGPVRDVQEQALVLAEEAGEVCRAIVKRAQKVRGSHAEWTAEIQKELGDVVITLYAIRTSIGEFDPFVVEWDFPTADTDLQAGLLLACQVGDLCGVLTYRVPSKVDGRVHWVKTIMLTYQVFRAARAVAAFEAFDLDEVVQARWDHVKARNVDHDKVGS